MPGVCKLSFNISTSQIPAAGVPGGSSQCGAIMRRLPALGYFPPKLKKGLHVKALELSWVSFCLWMLPKEHGSLSNFSLQRKAKERRVKCNRKCSQCTILNLLIFCERLQQTFQLNDPTLAYELHKHKMKRELLWPHFPGVRV